MGGEGGKCGWMHLLNARCLRARRHSLTRRAATCTESMRATPGTLHKNASERHVFLIATQLLGFQAGFPQSDCSSGSVEQRATHLVPGRGLPSCRSLPLTHCAHSTPRQQAQRELGPGIGAR